MPAQISSLQNQRIKQIVKLNNRRQRDQQKRTLVEGVREVSRALQAGLAPYEAYICRPLLDEDAEVCVALLAQLADRGSTELFEVSPAVFEKIAYRGESGGILLVIPYFQLSLADISLGQPPFLVVVEAAEKPGNLGAILRTADAAGVDGLVVCQSEGEAGTDIYNPNVIRASLGAIFTVPTVTTTNGRVQQWLREHDVQIIATTPDGQRPYTAVDLTGPVAILLGSEARGLSQEWLNAAHQQVVIPMHGAVDSLNLSVATALLLYEVVRQRSKGSYY